ncbi:GntR family transcriptional regulator [Deinococcus reticulitermitis]|uniref:GntR family transcriptional regulator n=1 Tax=Deinococcus reticulitermitis TaxID=856736 RepID=A0A1H6Z5M7_9DEIO|nr:GntR family transcriptional regulator [Deinococcus reticulitermitis]SEJ48843.1 GntR family transcriptional regulator [Deinococcus reticulitermitis]
MDWLAPQINPQSGIPIYLQLSQVFTRAIQRGTLRAGDSLPTVRHLASSLRLAPNTVTRAYAELQRLDLIESRAGAGTTVSAVASDQFRDVLSQAALTEEFHDLLYRMVSSGVSLTEIKRQFHAFTLSQTPEAQTPEAQ